MLDPKLQNENIWTNTDGQALGNHEIKTGKTQELQGTNNKGDKDEKKSENDEDETEAIETDVKLDQTTDYEVKDESNDVQSEEELIMDNPKDDDDTAKEEKGIESEPIIEVRRSQRKRNQRMVIQPDQIGDCDLWRYKGYRL